MSPLSDASSEKDPGPRALEHGLWVGPTIAIRSSVLTNSFALARRCRRSLRPCCFPDFSWRSFTLGPSSFSCHAAVHQRIQVVRPNKLPKLPQPRMKCPNSKSHWSCHAFVPNWDHLHGTKYHDHRDSPNKLVRAIVFFPIYYIHHVVD